MLFRRDIFETAGGFDEGYYLYYEDVDLCARIRLAGFEVAQVTGTSVIHAAQRASHSSFRYARWHIRSMFRFFCKAHRLNLSDVRRSSPPAGAKGHSRL
jgi:GT2 family glycosyltransferase